MTDVVPAGFPAWTRLAEIEHYGGHTNKSNELGLPARQLRTDFDAAMLMRLADHAAACARTCPFCWIVLTNGSAAGAITQPTVHSVYMMSRTAPWGYSLLTETAAAGSYGANTPIGMPQIYAQALGITHVIFDSSFTDEYGVSGAVTLKSAHAAVLESGAYSASCDVADSSLDFTVWNTATAAMVGGVKLCVEVS